MSKKSTAPALAPFLSVLALGLLLLVLGGVFKRNELRSWLRRSDEAKQAKVYPEPQDRTYAQAIQLPQPSTTKGMPLEKAIQERRSRRDFSDKPVTMAELSQLLWSAQGITDPETGHRAAPSARGAYPFTVFVVVRNVSGLEPGLYEYLPKTQSLGSLMLADAGQKLSGAGVQPGAQQAPVVFVLSAAYGKAQKTLGESAVSSSLLEAGHIGQNMYLQTESLRMSMVVMAGFDAAKVGSALSLDPAETVVYLMPFGHTGVAQPEAATVKGATTEALPHFTAEELSRYDGKEGRSAYYAFEGKVYDVTNSALWKGGLHYTVQAGQDLTGKLEGAPHGTEVFAGFPVVGTYGDQPTPTPAAVTAEGSEVSPYVVAGAVGAVVVVGGAGLMLLKRRK